MGCRLGSTPQSMQFEVGRTLPAMLWLGASDDYCLSLQRSDHCSGFKIDANSFKVGEFYFIRYILAFVCALCQTQMFRVINGTLNPRIALFFMMAMIFSPGMFHASASFLPSSFAMYTTMLGMAAFMNWRGGLKTALGMFYFSIGGILGWPFAIALSAPFLLEELIFASLSSKDAFIDAIMRFIRGFVAGLLVLVRHRSAPFKNRLISNSSSNS
jgi:hypothetical protein